MRVGPHPVSGIFIREQSETFGLRNRHRGECPIKMEAEVAFMLLKPKKAKDSSNHQKLGKSKGVCFPQAFGGSMARPAP